METKTSKKIFVGILIAIVIAGLIDCGLYAYRNLDRPARGLLTAEPLNAEKVEKIIEPQSNLVTASYVYTNSETYEDSAYFYEWKIPFTTTNVKFTYSGTINIGFDMSALLIETVDNEKNEIRISLPQAQIVSCEIDPGSYHYSYENYSMFHEFTMDDVTDTLDQLKEKMITRASSDETFMKEASERGRAIITNLLKKADDTKDYTIIWV